MSYKKLPALDGRNNPCLNCPPIEQIADLRKSIAVGFGAAYLERDSVMIYDGEEALHNGKKPKTFKWAEFCARKEPDRDWRIYLHGPMHGETYQRQGENRWVLVESNEGFA